MNNKEKELIHPVLLCNSKGLLNPDAVGYAREPIIQSNLTRNFLRKKKWNSWSVFGEDLLFSATISHLDYVAFCFVYILNYETQYFYEKQFTIPLGRNIYMPEHVLEDVHFSSDGFAIHITHSQRETNLSVSIIDFDSDVLHAELRILHPLEDESLNVVIAKNINIFQFTAKHHTLPTNGFVKVGTTHYDFNSDYSFSVLDYSRGIWPRESEWNWAMASQYSGGKRIGLNFGGKWTDGATMTENAVFIDGKMMKIHEDIHFTYDQQSYKKPWRLTSVSSNTVNLTFTPFFQRHSKTDMKLVRSEVYQLIGYFNGYIQLADGTTLQIIQMLGSSEEHVAKW